nr:hypothetical protein K-LCC10_0349 [Kaumoebavirus]
MELIPGLPNDCAEIILEPFSGNALAYYSGVSKLWMYTLRPMIRRIVTLGKLCPDPETLPNVEEITAYIPHQSALYYQSNNVYCDYRSCSYSLSTSIYANFVNLEHLTFRYYHPMYIITEDFEPIVHVRSPHGHSLVYYTPEMLAVAIVDTRYSKRLKYKNTIAIMDDPKFNYGQYKIHYATLIGKKFRHPLPNTINVMTCKLDTFLLNFQKINDLAKLEALMVQIDTETKIDDLVTLKKLFKVLLTKTRFVELNHAPKELWLENFDAVFDEYIQSEMLKMEM